MKDKYDFHPFFHMAAPNSKKGSESTVRKHVAENNRCIFDDLEFQFITKVNVKTLGENLKSPRYMTF